MDDNFYICTICHRELPVPPAYCGIEPPQGYDIGGWFCGDCLGIGREYSNRFMDLAKEFWNKRQQLHLEYINKLNSLDPPSENIIDFFKDWRP